MPQSFTLESDRSQQPLAQAPFHRWQTLDGRPWAEFYRQDDRYLLRFPELADFLIALPGLEVRCHPAPGAAPQTLEHLYLNQVLPLVLSKRGKLVFHASAVAIGEIAVAFVAPSGHGKSTLAASFALAGYPFLTDDGLVVEPDGEDYLALPSHPSVRLWSDSEEALLPAEAQAAPAVSYTRKSRFLADDALRHTDHARPLRRVYFLEKASSERIQFTRMKPSNALVEWTRHSFLLDIEERSRVSSHFEQLGALVNGRAQHFRLSYPRDYGRLGEVRDAVISHLGKTTGEAVAREAKTSTRKPATTRSTATQDETLA